MFETVEFHFNDWEAFDTHSFVSNCRGRGRGVKGKFWEKNPQVYLIIIREWPKNKPSILINLDNSPPGAFYWNPLQLSTKE